MTVRSFTTKPELGTIGTGISITAFGKKHDVLILSHDAAVRRVMGMAMQVSDEGLRLIASFEGFRATPYNDPVNACTVGYGEKLHDDPCTPEELAWPPMTEDMGKQRLAVKVVPYAAAVERYSRPLRQCEFDALTSFTYNVGVGGYQASAVRVAVNTNGNVANALRQYVKGTNGVIYPGLIRRREAEVALFYKVEERMYTDEQIDVMLAERDDKIVKLNAAVWDHASWIGKLYNAVIDHAKRLAALDGK